MKRYFKIKDQFDKIKNIQFNEGQKSPINSILENMELGKS